MRTWILIGIILLWLRPVAGGALTEEPKQTKSPTQVSAVSTKPVSGKPVVIFPQANHTFEEVLEGAIVMHDFVFHNKGDAPLEIKEVKTS